MTTDRELLECAAKAAGYKPHGWDVEINRLLVEDDQGPDKPWNPLRDDGDALRLAVKLDISIRQKVAMVQADYPCLDEEFNERKVLCEAVLDDYCAATRRAVVRAAAAMAKTTA
jgi:phage host-nuclease inhibitor protein Gam